MASSIEVIILGQGRSIWAITGLRWTLANFGFINSLLCLLSIIVIFEISTWAGSWYRDGILCFLSLFNFIFGSKDVFLIFVELALHTFQIFTVTLNLLPSWWWGHIIWYDFLFFKKILWLKCHRCDLCRIDRLWSGKFACRSIRTILTYTVFIRIGNFLTLLDSNAEVLINHIMNICNWCPFCLNCRRLNPYIDIIIILWFLSCQIRVLFAQIPFFSL